MGRSTNYMDRKVMGIPITTFIATCASGTCYLLAIIILLACSCLFTPTATMFFIFLILALIAVITMSTINMFYSRYRFNCLSLSVSLLYSGAAALILYGIIASAINGGICMAEKKYELALVRSAIDDGSEETIELLLAEGNGAKGTTVSLNNSTFRPSAKKSGPQYHKTTASVFIWIMSGLGLAFQIVGHYYYG